MPCRRCDTVCVFRLQPSERRKHRNRRKRKHKHLLQSTRRKQRTSLKPSDQEWANTSTRPPRELTHTHTHTSVMMHRCWISQIFIYCIDLFLFLRQLGGYLIITEVINMSYITRSFPASTELIHNEYIKSVDFQSLKCTLVILIFITTNYLLISIFCCLVSESKCLLVVIYQKVRITAVFTL